MNKKIKNNYYLFKIIYIMENTNENQKPNFDIFIEHLEKNHSVQDKINIIGKVLHFIENEEVLYFNIFLNNSTNMNPFESDIKLGIELVNNIIPYIRILSDFTIPTLYDNRNYFYCLTNEHEYKTDFNNLNVLENILNDIINNGIANFLFCIKENNNLNDLVFYGEYELNRIYNINDFLENDRILKFYRINQIITEPKEIIEEKYIILTQLYFLIFKPDNNDKSYANLLYAKHLKNLTFNFSEEFNKKLNKNAYNISIISNEIENEKSQNDIEFVFINREDEAKIYEEPQDNNNHTEDQNEINEEKFRAFKDQIENKKKEINLDKYNIIIENYKSLFNHRSGKSAKSIFDKKKDIYEYDKLVEYCEKNYKFYKEKVENKDKEITKRMEFYMVNLNFLCSELIGFYDADPEKMNVYITKMKYYLALNEKA